MIEVNRPIPDSIFGICNPLGLKLITRFRFVLQAWLLEACGCMCTPSHMPSSVQGCTNCTCDLALSYKKPDMLEISFLKV